MTPEKVTLLMIPPQEWSTIITTQKEILEKLNEIQKKAPSLPPQYITAIEFMSAVNIKRTKFDQLVQTQQIKTIKKKRKIYVLASEIGRYFSDKSIL